MTLSSSEILNAIKRGHTDHIQKMSQDDRVINAHYFRLYNYRYSNMGFDKLMDHALQATERWQAGPKPKEVKRSLLFNSQYELREYYSIRYFAVLDMVMGMENVKDMRQIRHHDDIYTQRMPWKRMRMSFLQHIYSEYGYRVIRG